MRFLNDSGPNQEFDVHWHPMTRHRCYICSEDYDYIVHLENVAEELDFMYQQLNGQRIPKMIPKPVDKYSENEKWKQLKKVPFSLINDTLHRIYYDDYLAFGYKMPTLEEFNRETIF